MKARFITACNSRPDARHGPDRRRNFFLGVPREKVRGMSREMQVLLNYELLPPAKIMGQVSGYHPIKTLDPDFILPVLRRDAGSLVEPVTHCRFSRRD